MQRIDRFNVLVYWVSFGKHARNTYIRMQHCWEMPVTLGPRLYSIRLGKTLSLRPRILRPSDSGLRYEYEYEYEYVLLVSTSIFKCVALVLVFSYSVLKWEEIRLVRSIDLHPKHMLHKLHMWLSIYSIICILYRLSSWIHQLNGSLDVRLYVCSCFGFWVKSHS